MVMPCPSIKPLFAILQKYDFSSKSQPPISLKCGTMSCLRYCKSTIFQANHNRHRAEWREEIVVCDTAKVRFFKQITTYTPAMSVSTKLFAILQKYDFSSKSQLLHLLTLLLFVVCDTAKVRFFKQITTACLAYHSFGCCLRYCKSRVSRKTQL